ncbi:MAG: effector binding domain-containing protein [Oscillospiraceae bacterium]|jgi:AraC family transcriptional regulator|nr:effector binding domain-containing protein [Oscillospiraceae bacterium]
MDLLSQLNAAMQYVEAHIDDDMALDDVSSVTSYSPYHFGRLFYYIAELPLSEYIRKRKLSLAAAELQGSNVRVIDLAVKYGYDSADSFARAFAKQHGITPSAARQAGVNLKIFLPLTFQIKIQGVNEMNWRIEEREAFEVFGIERIFGNDETGLVPDFWTQCHQRGSYEKLLRDAGDNGHAHIFGGVRVINAVCGYRETIDGAFPYMICALKTSDSNTAEYATAVIPKSTWAVFRSDKIAGFGEAIPTLFNRAYSEWLPSSGYDKANTADLELYCMDEDGGMYEEVWLPVVKR